MNDSKSFYFANLDGLRAIAALSVISYHFHRWFLVPDSWVTLLLTFDKKSGNLGVNFFFILSGFLITYLLLKEQSKYSKINIWHFYTRRLLRIWPIYFISLLIGFLVYPGIQGFLGNIYHENANVWMYLFFLPNFDHIYNGFSSNGLLGVQWSVAVEEQFYLLWPIVFLFFSKRTFFPFLLVGFILFSIYFYFNAGSSHSAHYHFLSNLRFLASGCFAGWLCFSKPIIVTKVLSKIPKWIHGIVYLLSLLTLFFNHHIPNVLFNELMILFFFTYVIVEQNFSESSFFKIGDSKLLTHLGRISYGLYLYHMVAIYIVLYFYPNNSENYYLYGALVVALTYFMSELSYAFIEKKFLLLKVKFSQSLN